jgi:predicted ATPase/transcriptional regulator with XRE-family HTH domain
LNAGSPDWAGASTRLGEWLSRQRRARDLTQEDLAERLGCSVWSVQKIETGTRRPSRQIAELLAEYFGIPEPERAAFVQFARGLSRAWRDPSAPVVAAPEAAPEEGPRSRMRPNNLATQLTSFVGRVIELPRVRDLMLTGEVRLLTLTGPPGTGKTRLALQVATELLKYTDFEDGVYFVNLAPIGVPVLVIPEIARTLDVREERNVSLLDSLRAYLRDKCLLLVLDNFEQVVEAAPQVAELLMSAPGLKVLVTSREPLHVRGEKEFPVPPLPLPDPAHLPPIERLGRYEALRLFIERAADVKDDFELTDDNAAAVVNICARLDGLPMAIELAAARIKFLPPHVILSRLASSLDLLTGGPRDLPARQRTLRSAIEWSYNLLEEAEKALFRRLSVFVGGGTLEAIESVCNAEGDLHLEVVDGVESLVDKSLLRQEEARGDPRFAMLETIHEYARWKSQESGEIGPLRREHALYYMKVAEEGDAHLRGADQQEWLARLNDEHDNLRAVLQWAWESDSAEDAEIGLKTAGALWYFWSVRGHLSEGREQIGRLLDKAKALETLGSSEYLTKALNAAGILADLQGDYDAARLFHEESLALKRDQGDKRGIAISLNNLASVAQQQGDYTTARSLYEESLALKKELGDKWSIAISLNNLGLVVQEQGDYAAARALYEESLALARELGDTRGVAISLSTLGNIAHLQGDNLGARSLYEQSLALKKELGDKRGIAMSLSNLGLVALEQRDYANARSRFEESLALREELGDKWGIALSLAGLGGAAVGLGNSGSGENAPEAAGDLSEVRRGVRLLGVVEALLESTRAVLQTEDRLPYERAIASARALLGEDEYGQLWAEGRAMTLQQAIEYALGQS